ncbi:MAG: hypothetical protein H6Q07_2257 [Acidobacteria bacterium]|jgi:hypothetical protein|nr:hypothetical protein [Acidobacteriota bacterium]
MKRLSVLSILLLLLVAGNAMAQDVRYNYDPGTDFSKYKTYKWVENKDGAHPDQIADGQIKQAIDSQLVLKGLTKSADEKADMYVSYQIAVNQEKQWNTMGMGGPGSWRWGGTGTATSSTINIGTLAVGLYDAAAKKLVWRGDATKTLNPSKDPAKNQKNMQKAVAKLMKKYPPPVKK